MEGAKEHRYSGMARWARVLYVLLATGLFSLPLLAALYLRADPLTIGNESVAYRFLYSERLLEGEGATVWVLAGFFTTAVQNVLLAGINAIWGVTAENLRLRIHLFVYATNALHSLVAAGVFVLAARSSRLRWTDRLLLALVGLGPLYLPRTAGFYYYSLPDYYLTNVVLTLVAVFLFQREWRREGGGRPVARCATLGGVVGLMLANKITLAPLGAVVVAAAVLAPPARMRTVAGRALLAAGAAAVTWMFVLLAFYLFKADAVLGMLWSWLRIVTHPGGEAGFWTASVRRYLVGQSYGFVIAVWLLSVVAGSCLGLTRRSRDPRAPAVLVLTVLGGAAWGYFLYKRPAGTTFFEASVALLGLSACALTVAAAATAGRWLVGVVVAGSVAFGVASVHWKGNLGTLSESRPWADGMWRLHREVLDFANGRDIVAVHPENGWGYGGVPEFLLKGSADTPTWNVGVGGQEVLRRYGPGISFRHRYGGTSPDAPFPGGVVVYWVDVPPHELIASLYPALGEAEANPANVARRWVIPIQGKRREITAHAVLLRDPPGSSPVRRRADR